MNSSIMTSDLATAVSGTMSPRPTPDSVVKLRNSRSIQPRAAVLAKLPGASIWQTEYIWAKAQASRVKVAPTA
ncbi:hypothetical protein D3C72_2530290 [compost metagenome]